MNVFWDLGGIMYSATHRLMGPHPLWFPNGCKAFFEESTREFPHESGFSNRSVGTLAKKVGCQRAVLSLSF